MTVRAPFLALVLAATAWAQTCPCGVDPPGPPRDRELRPYANTPADLRPYGNFREPYYEHYQRQVEYNGAARDGRTLKPAEVSEVRIGFLGPIENHPDEALGRRMLNGATLAVDEANARGGYCGKPFRLMIHNDQALWGASSNEIVRMTYDEQVWAMLGSISGDSTHIALRVSLKTELPIVNSAATDPTIPETIIPWYFTTIQDDRVQSYTLARRIYSDLKLTRVAILRINDRYGRFGVAKFKDAARRLGHPVVIEQKYLTGATDFRRQLSLIEDSGAEAIVIWGDQLPTAAILRQMRELGMKQRVFGSFRTVGDELVREAGEAAEGFEAVYPFDLRRDDPGWLAFRSRFEKVYAAPPEVFAALAYDTMNVLLNAICRAGLNRGKIRDALAGTEHYKGVTGEMTFDPNSKNIVPMFLAAVHQGKLEYRRYPMEAPHARAGGPSPDRSATPATPPAPAPAGNSLIVLFGPGAPAAAAEPDVAAAIARSGGRYVVAPVESEVQWGRASTALVDLVLERRAAAIIAVGRNPSHLASQIAAKSFLPIIAISDDRSLTAVNLSWVFRLPAGTPVHAALERLLAAAGTASPDRLQSRNALAASGAFDSRGEPLP